jgi:hypothetical protein
VIPSPTTLSGGGAEGAMVARTTPYRYFPDQESLLLELSVKAELVEVDSARRPFSLALELSR